MSAMFVFAAVVLASDLSVRLDAPKAVWVQGEPILVAARVENEGPDTLALARSGREGFRAVFTLEPLAGEPGTLCPELGRGSAAPLSWIPAPPGWRETFTRRFECGIPPGEYVLRFWIVSGEPWASTTAIVPPPVGLPWSGRVDAPPRSVRVVPPEGIDRAAFDAFSGRPLDDPDRLLAEFPTSTYAGYALLHGGPWPIDRDEELATAANLEAVATRDPGARAQVDRLLAERRAMILDRIARLEAYLRARPDFVYAEFMRLELGIRREEAFGRRPDR